MLAHETAAHSVLVVDDEPQVLTALKDILESEYTVFVETSPFNALEFLNVQPNVSVIISDQRMAGMAGDEFLAKARGISGATRLLITGYADLKAVIRAINEGQIFGYISKPWDAAQLTVSVHKAMEYFEMTRELARERALLHNLMDSVPDAVFFKDVAHRYLKVNRATATMMGLADPERAVGRTAAAFWSDERTAALERDEDAIRRTGQPIVDRVERFVTRDGVDRWFSKTTAPIFDDRGGVTGFVGVARDISERERSRQALLESEERYRSLYNNTPVMMHSIDSEGRIISVSDLWCETLGYERDVVVGRPSTDFMAGTSRQQLNDVIVPECLRVGLVKDSECQFVCADGRVIDTLLSAVAEFDEAHEVVRLLVVMADVTEKKALQGQLLQSQKMEAIGHLTGGIAHDFNNLLTVILGNLDLLNEGVSRDSALASSAEAATRATIRGAELTHRLLAFSRRQILEPATVNLNATIAGLADMIARTLGEPIDVRTALASDLWLTRIDPAQLESTLLNLCVNARDAMPTGGTLTIATANVTLDVDASRLQSSSRPGDYVRLTVSDTGSGIPRELLGRVFEPFFTTKEVGKGTGLGLSIVYGFVNQSDGFVDIDSALDLGTTVSLHFPRLADVQAQVQVEKPSTSVPRGSETVLVVEDQRDVRDTAVTMLASLGYQVLTANSGPAALRILEGTGNIDLLFTDMIMPGNMTGPELVARARSFRPSLKVLYTSGFAEGAARIGEHVVPDAHWIAKPYRRTRLAERVRSVLDA